MSDSLDWLGECIDVPIECTNCHMLTTLGGVLEDETMEADLCDCGANYRIYVGDAPGESQGRLATLIDVLQTCEDAEASVIMDPDAELQRQVWRQQAEDDQRDT